MKRVIRLETPDAFASAIRENAYALAGKGLAHFDVSADVRKDPAYESASQPYLYTFQFVDRRNGVAQTLSYEGRNEVDTSEYHAVQLGQEHLAAFGATLAREHPPVSFEVDRTHPRMRVFVPERKEVPVNPEQAHALFAQMRAAVQ